MKLHVAFVCCCAAFIMGVVFERRSQPVTTAKLTSGVPGVLIEHEADAVRSTDEKEVLEAPREAAAAGGDEGRSSSLLAQLLNNSVTPLEFTSKPSDGGAMPHVCIGVRVIEAHFHSHMPALLYSLVSQVFTNWDLFILDTTNAREGSSEKEFLAEQETRAAAIDRIIANVDDPRIHRAPQRRFISDYPNDFGYVSTDRLRLAFAHEHPSSRRKGSYCSYMLFTNGDNIYHMAFLELARSHMSKHTSVIVSHFLHHKDITPVYNTTKDVPEMKPNLVPHYFARGSLDLGCGLVEGEAAATLTGFTLKSTDEERDFRAWRENDYAFYRAVLRKRGDADSFVLKAPLMYHQ